MAEVNTGDKGNKGKHDKKRAKKTSTSIDMTPMVDLAFLLLTFFILTSTFNKPKAMELSFPADPKDDSKNIKVNNALTLIMSKNDAIYYYYGEFYPEKNAKQIAPTQLLKTDLSFDGIHKILLERNEPTIQEINLLTMKLKNRQLADSTYKRLTFDVKSKQSALTVLIKADSSASYKNVIDVIDELNICNVGKYAVVDLMLPEQALLNTIKE
jgi:biopolymer transport protein ExbD